MYLKNYNCVIILLCDAIVGMDADLKLTKAQREMIHLMENPYAILSLEAFDDEVPLQEFYKSHPAAKNSGLMSGGGKTPTTTCHQKSPPDWGKPLPA